MTLGEYARTEALKKGLNHSDINKLLKRIDESPLIDRDNYFESVEGREKHDHGLIDQWIGEMLAQKKEKEHLLHSNNKDKDEMER